MLHMYILRIHNSVYSGSHGDKGPTNLDNTCHMYCYGEHNLQVHSVATNKGSDAHSQQLGALRAMQKQKCVNVAYGLKSCHVKSPVKTSAKMPKYLFPGLGIIQKPYS